MISYTIEKVNRDIAWLCDVRTKFISPSHTILKIIEYWSIQTWDQLIESIICSGLGYPKWILISKRGLDTAPTIREGGSQILEILIACTGYALVVGRPYAFFTKLATFYPKGYQNEFSLLKHLDSSFCPLGPYIVDP